MDPGIGIFMGHSSVDLSGVAKWLPLAKKGDETALGMLIDLTQSHLYRFCVYLCNNPAQAEDLCQETYLKSLSHLESIKDEKGLLPWLFRVAKNQFIDFTRSARSKEDSLEESDGTGDAADASPQGHGGAETILAVRQCLSQLDPEERLVIILVDSEGYSYQEAAQVIGITEEALKSRIHRARKAFLDIFEKS